MVNAKQLFESLISYSTDLYQGQADNVKWEDIRNKLSLVDIDKPSKQSEKDFIQSVLNSFILVEAYKLSNRNSDFYSAQQSLLDSFRYFLLWKAESEI